MKVAIAGLAQSSRHLIPWGTDWEVWGMAWDSRRYELDRTFEIHDLQDIRGYSPNLDAYFEKISACNRLYMQEQYLPSAIVYPFDAVAADVGDYWCSSIGYMLALAIHEKAEEIGLYGVDMRDDTEYAYQRANCEYLIGLARGRGITVHIPEMSPLCKFKSQPGTNYNGRYGKNYGPV